LVEEKRASLADRVLRAREEIEADSESAFPATKGRLESPASSANEESEEEQDRRQTVNFAPCLPLLDFLFEFDCSFWI